MPLRKSPTRTPALLAANRANARKSTGPRTPQGKARSAFNGLKHGGRAVVLKKRLMEFGDREYLWFYSSIVRAFSLASGRCLLSQAQVERLAMAVWCRAWKLAGVRPKPESPLLSIYQQARVDQFRIRIEERLHRAGLVFWRQRRRYWTLKRVMQMVFGNEPIERRRHWKPEDGWRARKLRLLPPSKLVILEFEKRMRRRAVRR